jgi:hypothetical protein
MKHRMAKWLEYGILALVFCVPLAYMGGKVYPHITSKVFLFYGFIDLLFFYWLYLAILDRAYRLAKKQLALLAPILLYVLWMTIAGILAVNPHLSFWSSFGRATGLLTLYHGLALLFITLSLVQREGMRYVRILFGWFLASATIVAATVWAGPEAFNFKFNFII